MASPFGDFYNALLDVPTGATTVALNPTTGNYERNGAIALYKAYLKPARPTITPEVGVDRSSVYLAGFLVDPMVFPEGTVFPLRIKCEVNLATGTQQGTLELGLAIASAFGVEAITGTKLQGWFQSGGG